MEKDPLWTPTRIATVRGIRETSYGTELFTTLDYLGRRFLSAGPASALWEKIPYSFVADWFVNLSPVIDSLDNTLTGGSNRVIDRCVSEKYGCQIQHKYNSVENATDRRIMSVDGFTWGLVSLQHYHRNPYLPGLHPVGSGRFGKKQASLLAALLHQIVAKLR